MIKVLESPIKILITIIIQKYLVTNNSLCIIWNDKFEYSPERLQIQSENQIELISLKISGYLEKYENFIQSLRDLIEISNCENFIVFEDDIPKFLNGFTNISYALEKRFKFHKFFLIYSKKAGNLSEHHDMKHQFVNYLPNILIAQIIDATSVELWTKYFVGQTIEESEKLIYLETFNVLDGIFRHNVNLYPDKVYNLKGKTIRLGTFDYRPFVIATNDETPNMNRIINSTVREPIFVDGTEARFLMHFCKRHNCTIDVFIQKDKDWGTAYWNSTGEGLLGALNEGKCEFAINALYLWQREYLHFDISSPLSRSGVTNIVPVPLPKISFLLPLQPFSWKLWLGVGICLFIEFLCLLITYWIQNLEKKNQSRKSFVYGFGVSLRIFLSQGFEETYKDAASRIILSSCLIIDLIIDSVYDGGLASILTLPASEEPTDTLERLVRHRVKWTGTSDNWLFSMEKSEDPLIRKIIQLYESDSKENLHDRSFTENIGFVIERLSYGHYSVPEYISREASKRYQVMKEDMYYEYCVAFVPKLWPYLENFDRLVLNLQSSGILQYWEWDNTVKYLDDYIQETLRGNSSPDDGTIRKLDVSNFIGIMLIWIFGTILSCFVLLFEVIYHKIGSD